MLELFQLLQKLDVSAGRMELSLCTSVLKAVGVICLQSSSFTLCVLLEAGLPLPLAGSRGV